MAALIYIALLLVGIGTWLTHVVHCLAHSEWGFLIAGAIIVPIANIHGLGLWLGWW